jgi:2-phosphosulfolactate phosphatase
VWNDARAATLGEAEGAVVAAKRGQPGYTLSPASYGAMPAGVRLVLPSPNGSTLSFAAGERGVPVVAGSLRNAAAVARWCTAQRRPVAIVPAGERWVDGSIRFALEDWLGAGAIAARIGGDRSGEAEAAVAAFERLRGDLRGALARCPSGRELIGRDYPQDVDLASALDVDTAVPRLAGNAFTLAAS